MSWTCNSALMCVAPRSVLDIGSDSTSFFNCFPQTLRLLVSLSHTSGAGGLWVMTVEVQQTNLFFLFGPTLGAICNVGGTAAP